MYSSVEIMLLANANVTNVTSNTTPLNINMISNIRFDHVSIKKRKTGQR